MSKKKGILVVSFGTSYPDTRKVTIEAIKDTICSAYPNLPVYEAWTSKKIMAKILRTTGEKIFNVTEAMEHMLHDGITDVCIQPTHVINGIENDLMREDALKFRNDFQSISFGSPLITSTEDMQNIVQILADSFSDMTSEEALILMGHGSEHHSNTVYAALDYMFKEAGYPNIHIGTVEAYPELGNVFRVLRRNHVKKVHLAPFMIVAGDHATNDMAGDNEKSWMTLCKNAGYEVTCHIKGLGEYPAVRKMFLEHLQSVL